MRNGDYTPSRFEAQNDAVNLLFAAKTQSNPENTVGLMTMSGERFGFAILFFFDTHGRVLIDVFSLHLFYFYCLDTSPEVLVTLTSDIGKILSAIHKVKIHGSSSLSTSIQIAQVNLS
jgi:26S proteasome regulatory subunit N10